MSSENKKQQYPNLAVEFLSRVWGPDHELDAIDELMTEDYFIVTGGKTIEGRDNFKNWVREFQQVLLDARTISEDSFISEDGSKIVSRWICSGRNHGIFGLKADEKTVSFTGIAIWQVRDNKLSACWVERSALELYKELSA